MILNVKHGAPLAFKLDMKPWWAAGVCCSLSLLWAAAKGERSYDAKLVGGKVCMGARRGMDNATGIMKTDYAVFLQPLSNAKTCTHWFYSGILYWDVWYFGKKEGWVLFMPAWFSGSCQCEKCLVHNKTHNKLLWLWITGFILNCICCI